MHQDTNFTGADPEIGLLNMLMCFTTGPQHQSNKTIFSAQHARQQGLSRQARNGGGIKIFNFIPLSTRIRYLPITVHLPQSSYMSLCLTSIPTSLTVFKHLSLFEIYSTDKVLD